MPTRTVNVQLGANSYPVLIGVGMLPNLGEHLRALSLAGPAVMITDDVVDRLYGQTALEAVRRAGYTAGRLVVAHGERAKALPEIERLAEAMAESGLGRKSFVIALGGGVIGDLAGFLAAVYYRGVPYVQVPTTIMAQVDSSVGGKTAVNLAAGKNLLGAFHQPVAVLADVATLSSLGRRERNEGFAEVIKYGVIRDRALLTDLAGGDPPLDALIERCVRIKAVIVEEDEHEVTGVRALLNFGHTIGHAIEAVAGYGTLLHGEAISLGMIAAARLSVQHAGLLPAALDEIARLLRQFALPTELPAACAPDAIIKKVFSDKKFLAGQIRFVLTRKLGSAYLADHLTREDLVQAIESLRP